MQRTHHFTRPSVRAFRTLVGAPFMVVMANFSSLGTAFGASPLPISLPWMNHTADQPATYQSADHPNAVYVLEMYFRTCPYCNDNAPNVDDLATEFADNARVQVLDVGIDRADIDYSRWIAAHHPNHPVLKDANRLVAGALGTQGYPSTYVVNCRGEVLYSTSGVWDGESIAGIRAAIQSGLASTCQ